MRKLVLTAVLVLMATGAQAVTLNVVGGQLMGASGVDVGGSLYDVQFVNGTCIDLYNGCDEVSDFTFQSEASAGLASQALLDQVFLDGVFGQFDSEPLLTNGCPQLHPVWHCAAFMPYGFRNPSTVLGRAAINAPGFLQDAVDCENGSPYKLCSSRVDRFLDPLTQEDGIFFAVWTSSAVPEPSTALLLGLGLVGLAARRRV